MFVEVNQTKNEADAEDDGETYASAGAWADGMDRMVAPRHVDKGAIWVDQGGSVGRKSEETPAAVGQGAIGVESIVPVVERCFVKVHLADQCVGGIVGGEEFAGVEERHRGPGRTAKAVYGG